MKLPSVLFSLPVVDRLNLKKSELLPKIESGELDHIDFVATVFKTGPNENHYQFAFEFLAEFAASFEGVPFLRNHETSDIAARDGTVLAGELSGEAFKQTIRITTRRGMLDLVEGRIDRFSIGWFYKDVLCTVCGSSYLGEGCQHQPGREYGGKVAELLFTFPRGKETSAVNAAAVQGTGIEALLKYQEEVGNLPLSRDAGHTLPSPRRGEGDKEITGLRADNHTLPNSGRVIKMGGAMPGPNQKGDTKMSDPIHGGPVNPATSGGPTPVTDVGLAQLEANRQAAAELLGEAQRQADLQAQLEASNAILIAQCQHLLDSGLGASRLPEVVQNRIRKTFEGKAFKAAELTAAISEARDEVASLTAGQLVHGPARIGQMFNSADQITLALEDLLGVERTAENQGKKVARLSGIREAYIALTGDREFVGGYFPEFSLGDTTTFPVVVKNALNKRLENAWKKYGAAGYDWWKKVVTVEHFETLNQIDWLITGTIGSLPTVAEKGEYTELAIGDNGETSDWTKYGGYIGLTLEAILRDDVRAFKRLPDELAMAGIRNISYQIAYIFTQASGTGPTLSDTGVLFNATAVTTKGGHKNLLTTALGTDLVAWRAVEAAMYAQPMHVAAATGYWGTGKAQAIRPRYALVPMALKGAADDLFLRSWTSNGENMVYGYVEPIVVPDFTDTTDWAAVADPNILPGIMIGEIFGVMPQIFLAGSESDPAMFANDESRLKVRQFLTVGIANWRALHKSNVAGA